MPLTLRMVGCTLRLPHFQIQEAWWRTRDTAGIEGVKSSTSPAMLARARRLRFLVSCRKREKHIRFSIERALENSCPRRASR